MEQWLKFIESNYGSIEEFNKLPYRTRHEIWEEYINE